MNAAIGTTTNLTIGYNLPTSNDLIIGNYFGSGRHPFNGLIDEPAVFGKALNAQEVWKHYFAVAGGLSAQADGVNANLTNGTATGLRGGISRIQNVTGSQWNDILVGSNGAPVAGGNRLKGGAGRDLLIVGAYATFLEGGNDDDILIGGTTDHDTNDAALTSILAEWTRSDIDYATRVAHLVSGSGVPALSTNTIDCNAHSNRLLGDLV